jgi:hypothetical protein
MGKVVAAVALKRALRGDQPASELEGFLRTAEVDPFCDFSERFLTDEQGRPLVIEPFQRQILSDYFDGVRETVVLLSKNNGKTSLFAGLALWHVITEELRKQLRLTQRVVHCDRTDGKVAVLAADADTLDGWAAPWRWSPSWPPQVRGELRPAPRRPRAAGRPADRLPPPPATTRTRRWGACAPRRTRSD